MIFRFRDSWNFLELESEMNVPFRESWWEKFNIRSEKQNWRLNDPIIFR